MTEPTQELEGVVAQLVGEAPAFMVIETVADAERVAGYLTAVRTTRKKIAEFFEPMQTSAHRAWKAICERRNQLDMKPAEFEGVCKRLLADWQDKEKKRVEEAQRKLDEEARQGAAAQARVDGDEGQAKAIESGRVAVSSTQVVKPVGNIAGVTSRDLWTAEVNDKAVLARAIISGRFPLDWLQFDMEAIEAVVRASKGQVTIPGVIARRTTSIASKRLKK